MANISDDVEEESITSVTAVDCCLDLRSVCDAESTRSILTLADTGQERRNQDSPDRETVPEDTRNILDGGWGWCVVLGCMLCHFFLLGLSRSFGVLYISLKEKFNASDVATSWVQSLFGTLKTITSPLVSILCDRFSCRKVAFVGGLFFGAGCVMSAFATNIFHLNLTFGVIAGLGGSLSFTPMFIILNQYFHKKKGIAMSLSTMGSGLGTVALAPLRAYLLEKYGYFGTSLVVGALAFNTCVGAALYRPAESQLNWIGRGEKTSDNEQLGHLGEEDTDSHDSPDELYSGINHEAPLHTLDNGPRPQYSQANLVSSSIHADVVERAKMAASCGEKYNLNATTTAVGDKGLALEEQAERLPEVAPAFKSSCFRHCTKHLDLFRSATYWLYCLNMAGYPCGVQIVVTYMPSAMKEHGMTNADGALTLAVSGAADMVGRILWGFVFDMKTMRLRRRAIHHGLGLFTGVSVFLLAFQTSLSNYLVVGIMWGLFEGGWHAQRATIGAEIVPKEQVSYSMGYITFFQGMGTIVWPTLAGFVKDVSGTYSWCFVLGSCYMLVTSIALLLDYIIGRESMHNSEEKDTGANQDPE